MLTKRRDGQARRTRLQNLTAVIGPVPVNRRAFLQRSGLVAGGLAAAGTFQLGTIRKVAAISLPQPGIPIEIKKSICTHCAVGCTGTAEVQTGVWTGQERPRWEGHTSELQSLMRKPYAGFCLKK